MNNNIGKQKYLNGHYIKEVNAIYHEKYENIFTFYHFIQ